MPAIADDTKRYYMQRIKIALVANPGSSLVSLQKFLEEDSKDPLKLTTPYIGKLVQKIRIERSHRYLTAEHKDRVADLEDKTQVVNEQMWRILFSPTAGNMEKVAAGKTILEGEHRLYEAQLNAGVFVAKKGMLDKPAGQQQTSTRYALPADILNPILEAFKTHGILKVYSRVVDPEPVPAITAGPGTGDDTTTVTAQ